MTLVVLAFAGSYLHLSTDEHGPVLRADGATLDVAAVFERVDLCHGRIALRTLEGRYLASCPAGTVDPGIRPEDEMTACSAFEEITWSDGQVSFITCDRTFLGVDADGGIVGDRIASGSCERFEYVTVPADLAVASGTVPQQGRSADGDRSAALA